jgi:hypothetical protein
MAEVASPGGFVGTKLFVVPKGAPTNYRGHWKPAGRKQIIELDKPGRFVERYGPEREWLVITWPGAGGYWRRVVQHHGEFVDRWP